MQGVDTVFHLASRVTDWGNWPAFEGVTVNGTQNMLAAAASAGVRRFVHFSTVAVYDDRDFGRNPIVCEDAPHSGLGDRTHGYYVRAKVLAEEAAFAAHGSGKLSVTVLRPALVYGPRDSVTLPRLVEYLEKAACAVGGPRQSVYRSDLCRRRGPLCNRRRPARGCDWPGVQRVPQASIGTRDFQLELCKQLDIA